MKDFLRMIAGIILLCLLFIYTLIVDIANKAKDLLAPDEQKAGVQLTADLASRNLYEDTNL